jgi:hypothetical protein
MEVLVDGRPSCELVVGERHGCRMEEPAPYAYGAGITIANYDVTADGQRFLMVKDESTAGRLRMILNWTPGPSR